MNIQGSNDVKYDLYNVCTYIYNIYPRGNVEFDPYSNFISNTSFGIM